MSIKCEEYNQVCVVTLNGDFVGEETELATRSVTTLIEDRQIVDFVFDFEKSGFADSAGLEMLLAVKRRVEDAFGQVKLANLDENMRKILEITRLEHRFECHSDLASALKTMR